MGRSFSFAVIAGAIFMVVIIINIIASSNLKGMDDDHGHMGGGGTVKNVVLFVGSGLGPAGVTLARGFQETLRKGDASIPATLAFEPYLTATLRTRSSDNSTTDAAAAASALATGKKTANGMAAVDPQKKTDLESILEKARHAGLKTGFITTDSLTGPVAAAFTSHMEHSAMSEMVASEQLAAKIDLLMGGGSKYYSGDKAKPWTDASYNIIKTTEDLDKASKLPVLGVFADDKLDFAIDQNKQPTLLQMTKKALDLLHNDKGFFLVVEAGRIDDCAYNNDAACLAHEVLALQESFEAVADLLVKTKDTACLIASDRDSGGLVLGDWDPSKLVGSNASVAVIAGKGQSGDLAAEVLRATGLTFTAEELNQVTAAKDHVRELGDVISKRAGVSWSSSVDTGVDVNLYACGDASTDVPRGNVDNTAVGVYLMKKVPSAAHSMPSPTTAATTGGGHHHH